MFPTFLSLFKDSLITLDVATPASGSSPRPNIARLTKQVDGKYDLIKWISRANLADLFYFKEKNRAYEIAGIGNALNIAADSPETIMTAMDRYWQWEPHLTFCGGTSFLASHEASAEWQGFKRFRFTLPMIELRQEGGKLWITFNHVLDRQNSTSPESAHQKLTMIDERMDARSPSPFVRIVDQQHMPSHLDWQQIVETLLGRISEKHLRKAVLARKRIMLADAPWQPLDLLKALARIDEDSFLFFYQIDHDRAFLGRSPERLFALNDRRIRTEAIAGTRPRGKSLEEDRQLAQTLKTSIKELEEHRIVSDYIHRRMQAMCSRFRTLKTEEILRLKQVQHLITQFEGELAGSDHPLTTALALHPTPAICGDPTQAALDFIAAHEPFQRGWYAAPIGWMNRHQADFSVGIRSALIQDRSLHIFGGAGIVRQSDPLEEWRETDIKMKNFVSILKGIIE